MCVVIGRTGIWKPHFCFATCLYVGLYQEGPMEGTESLEGRDRTYSFLSTPEWFLWAFCTRGWHLCEAKASSPGQQWFLPVCSFATTRGTSFITTHLRDGSTTCWCPLLRGLGCRPLCPFFKLLSFNNSNLCSRSPRGGSCVPQLLPLCCQTAGAVKLLL